MDSVLISIDYQDPLWIIIAFLAGLAARQIKLPPMVGYLVAGFILSMMGVQNGPFLSAIADMGITLLLFTIGLKLRLGTLVKREVWGTASIHMASIIALATVSIILFGIAGSQLLGGLDFTAALIIGFALSFSSTVFAVKTLEDRGTLMSSYGQTVLAILVLQDIAAVIFLAISTGQMPTLWVVALALLIPARYVLGQILRLCGNEELLAVFGFCMALGGAALFEAVGLKGDLGALVLGALLAHHDKSNQLAKYLISFKDLFLVCFFLTIGLTGLPSWDMGLTAILLLFLIPIKAVLFIFLMAKFKMRARSAALGGITLGNYSEFGLIVAATAVSAGLLQADWLTIIALTMAGSLIISAIAAIYGDGLYERFKDRIKKWESGRRLKGDEDINLHGYEILVFGMGRVGRAAYDEMHDNQHEKIVGIDIDPERVERNCKEGRNVVLGDATNPEFWLRLIARHQEFKMILLSMANHHANLDAAQRMRERGYEGPIVATALYPDDEEELRENGIDEVFNIYAQAGSGAATHMHELLASTRSDIDHLS